MIENTQKKPIERLVWLSRLLDSSIPIGRSGYTIGLDPLIGLIPGIGDAIAAAFGSYIVIEAARLGASRVTLARMIINLGFDALLGTIPIFGDLFDFAFKANERNMRIVQKMPLREDLYPAGRLSAALILTLSMALLIVVTISALTLISTVKFFSWLIS